MTRVLVVDNFDSFVYTLAGYLQELGAEVEVVRNDEVDAQWTIIDPILRRWHETDGDGLPTYEAGTAGPEEADELLGGPTAWLFGNEARGLPHDLAAAADHRVRIPVHGRAESLNLSAAAAVCLYA